MIKGAIMLLPTTAPDAAEAEEPLQQQYSQPRSGSEAGSGAETERPPHTDRPRSRQQVATAQRRTGTAAAMRRPVARDALVTELRRQVRFGAGLDWSDIIAQPPPEPHGSLS
jgi:hypothetical protein